MSKGVVVVGKMPGILIDVGALGKRQAKLARLRLAR
jgi:hypothetical protein